VLEARQSQGYPKNPLLCAGENRAAVDRAILSTGYPIIGPADVAPALQAKFDQWEKASDETWAMIDQREVEER
jgi:hypothetical protein